MDSIKRLKYLILFIFFINIGCAGTTTSLKHRSAEFDWTPLIDRLSSDGFDKNYLISLYGSKEVKFNPRVMPQKITHKETKLNYAQFLEESRIRRGKEFINENKKLMQEIENIYLVPKEIQAAILLVETGFGSFLGNDLAINVLSSMAVSSNFDQVRPFLPVEYEIDEGLKERIKKKSLWAYDELKALLQYSHENKMNPLTIKGSIFGAIGICQFMPSNILKFGVDYNKDNRINLFEIEDAIASMANYLYHYGWKDGITREQQEKVIMKYNPSRPYTETILSAARLMGWQGY